MRSTLEAAGLDIWPGMQGKSLWPLLSGNETQTGVADVYCEYYNAMPWHREPHLPFALSALLLFAVALWARGALSDPD